MADEYYSGTKTEIEEFLASMKIGTSRIDAITPTELAEVQARIDDVLDDQLSATLYMPIQKVTDKNGHTVYPGTIRNIATKLVAAELVAKMHGEVDPNVSALADKWETQANEKIRQIVAREQTIRGQNYRTQNRFMPPNVAPLSPPGTPAAGGI